MGGLAENISMVLGFQYLMLVAVAFYTFIVAAPGAAGWGHRLAAVTARLMPAQRP
jgi:hypothetical protein